MTETPRTDEEVEIAKKFPLTNHGLWVSANFARELERELAELKLRYVQHPPVVANGALSDEEVRKLIDSIPGQIQVVYPLDEEWNAAIEACAALADAESGRQFSLVGYASLEEHKHKHGAKAAMGMEVAAAIRKLKRKPACEGGV